MKLLSTVFALAAFVLPVFGAPAVEEPKKAAPATPGIADPAADPAEGKAPVVKGPARWEPNIAAFEAADAKNPPPKGATVFVGSSSIVKWKSLAKDFPTHKVINRGFGGSQIEDSVAFADRIVTPYEPKMVVFYAGANDINAKKSAQRVLEDYQKFVGKVRAKLPEVPIAFISISGNPARWKQIETVKEANRLVEEYSKKEKNLVYIDTFSKMMGADGKPLPDIFVADNLHMNEKGYVIWTAVVEPYLPKE